MLTVATESYRTSAFAIRAPWEIRTIRLVAVLKRKILVLKRNAVPELSVDKSAGASNASVPSVSLATRSSAAVTLTSVWRILAERMPFASTPQAVTTANAHPAISVIPSPCAPQWPTTATILCIAHAAPQMPAPADTIARAADAAIYAMASLVDREPRVRWANAYARWDTSVIRTIGRLAVICAVNA